MGFETASHSIKAQEPRTLHTHFTLLIFELRKLKTTIYNQNSYNIKQILTTSVVMGKGTKKKGAMKKGASFSSVVPLPPE